VNMAKSKKPDYLITYGDGTTEPFFGEFFEAWNHARAKSGKFQVEAYDSSNSGKEE